MIFLLTLLNPTAAYHLFVAIENRRLSGCNCAGFDLWTQTLILIRQTSKSLHA
jgi:hypothetical protein